MENTWCWAGTRKVHSHNYTSTSTYVNALVLAYIKNVLYEGSKFITQIYLKYMWRCPEKATNMKHSPAMAQNSTQTGKTLSNKLPRPKQDKSHQTQH